MDGLRKDSKAPVQNARNMFHQPAADRLVIKQHSDCNGKQRITPHCSVILPVQKLEDQKRRPGPVEHIFQRHCPDAVGHDPPKDPEQIVEDQDKYSPYHCKSKKLQFF